VLKKAGILVAASAAGLLALSPLAFATDEGDYYEIDDERQVNRIDDDRVSEQAGLVNVGDVQVVDDANVCPAVPVAAGVGNLLGVLGGGSVSSEAGDVTCVNDESTEQTNIDD
jgi:hypothetical protein